MNGVEMRRRGGVLFVAVVVMHIILISAQVPFGSRTDVPVLESVTFGMLSEVQRLATGGVSGWRRLWRNYFALRNVRAENEELRRQLSDLQVRLQQQRALADRSRQLERLLELRDRSSLETTAATVIGAGASPDFRTMTVDKGTGDGLRPDMAVLSPQGVVGRIITPSPRAAKVQLLIDRSAAAGALIERSRAQGVIIGTGESERVRMDYVSENADVQVGDRVVTSGIDGIYPKGFAIGRVERVERGSAGFTAIEVRPAVNFSALEEVLIVLTPVLTAEEKGP
jgi:rod shape-determining protein MreC